MGVGMVAIVAASDADRTVQLIADRGVPAWIAGHVTAAAQNSRGVTLVGAHP
jgi:phosphoribosylformylglycinamidine cyclo-ligase